MANEFIEDSGHDLAPIVANLQNHLDELEQLRQSSENAAKNYANGCKVYDKCKNIINELDNDEKKVCCWPQNLRYIFCYNPNKHLFINFNFVKNLVCGAATCFKY